VQVVHVGKERLFSRVNREIPHQVDRNKQAKEKTRDRLDLLFADGTRKSLHQPIHVAFSMTMRL
jgi:hypothetical protein